MLLRAAACCLLRAACCMLRILGARVGNRQREGARQCLFWSVVCLEHSWARFPEIRSKLGE
eukprot:4059603-Lingulodinium_polyedra.AAC.1